MPMEKPTKENLPSLIPTERPTTNQLEIPRSQFFGSLFKIQHLWSGWRQRERERERARERESERERGRGENK